MKQLMDSPFVISGKRLERGEKAEGRSDELFVFEQGRKAPVGGPWPNDREGQARAVEWIVEREAKALGPGKLAVFEECFQRAGGGYADRYQVLFLVLAVRRGWSRATCLRYAAQLPPRLRSVA